MLILGTSQLRCREYFFPFMYMFIYSLYISVISIYKRKSMKKERRNLRGLIQASNFKCVQPNADEESLVFISALNGMWFVPSEV